MTNNTSNDVDASDDPLAGANRDELAAAVRLLAAALVEQREKPEGDLLIRAKKLLTRGGASAKLIDSYIRFTMQRAINVVRVDLAAFHTPVSREAGPRGSIENRLQYRINLTSDVTLLNQSHKRRVNATLCNISWGGAAVESQEPFADLNESVWLVLPIDKGDGIPVLSTVVRSESSEGRVEYGLRFDSMRPEDAQRFRQVLEVLTGELKEGGQRAAPRLVQRLDIEYDDTGDLRSTLEDISTGGLMIMVPNPLDLHQSILISLSSVDGRITLELRARVVHVAPAREGGIEMYRVGLKFEHPESELQENVEQLLQDVLKLGHNPGKR